MIAIKLDEDLPHDLVDFFRGQGFDAVNVRMQGWTGKSDEILLADIQQENRWLFTADKGFSDIRRYRPGSNHGIVLFRPDRESRQAYLALAAIVIGRVDFDAAARSLVVVTSRSIRIVHPQKS